ncbi:tetratricopeptide repeat protein [Magnetospirillum sulfuroxidans]|uniref:Tetratricopeptide repeat protein n=1 Tax=Magnetospirillum sulfuroxidans TaxID=611300 RepID=A0ABS5IBS5_9PROT|nr:tetratricopeptide repeat protein [Magnetospirillum sulfuroxidans]MBR9971731.1 tetratricopeptide repeat protein [Magnetospirillum sulfuroxidans]
MDQVGEPAGTSAAMEAELYAARAARDAADHVNALAAYEAALLLDSAHPDALAGKGAMLRALGRDRDALPVLLRVLDLDSHHLEARLELALTLQGLGRPDEARIIFAALVRTPEPPARAWHGLALLLLADGHEAAAESALRRTMAQAPDLIEARLQLADLLARRMDLSAATDLYHDILAMDCDNAAALTGLGQALIGLGRLDEAQDQLERSLAIIPDNPHAHLGRARLNLLGGHLQGAWDDLEWRWRAEGRKRPEPPGQSWNGDDDLAGRTILLWAEQGLAEIIHLLRYVREIGQRAGKVILGVPQPLVPLAKGLDRVFAVIASGQPLPRGIKVDYNASFNDLPRLFGTSLAGIPPAPYLAPPPGHCVPVVAPPSALLKVGLAWAGPRAGWSIPFPQVMALFGHPGAAFFGLQLGNRAQDVAQLAHPGLITDLSPTISNYGDLAGRIAEMDLIITVDGAVAHLAGALGKPVWVLLPVAADWRWMRGRDDSPWYGTARLFRQSRAGDWTATISQVMAALDDKLAGENARRQSMALAQSGERAAQRAFLSTHLTAGDLYVDIGCGADGTHVLDTASQELDDIRVLAVDARPGEADILEDTVAISGLSDIVTVERVAIGAVSAPVTVAGRKRSGRAVFALPTWVKAGQQCLPLADMLDRHPDLRGRRLVLRLGAKGEEAAILAGLGSYLPAIIVFRHADGGGAAALLSERGYKLFEFPGAIAAGPVRPFSGGAATVLAVAPDVAVSALYGDAGDPTSPASMAKASALAARLAAQGNAELAKGQANRAGATFARALAQDPGNVDANANLGGLLRRIGRADAAAACWRRALAAGGPPMVRANLANVLRESGHLEASEATFLHALTTMPDNPDLLYAFGLLERERGRPKEALGLFEKAETLRPGTVPGGELASALLKSGNLARGMAEMSRRRPVMLPPVDASEWDGGRLQARTILVRDENDAIDTIMLSRYIPMVALQGGLVTVECVPEVAPLLAGLAGVERVIARGEPIPAMDATVRLLDVPRLLGTTSRTTPPRNVPYLHLPEGMLPFRFPGDHRLHVGLSWTGSRPRDRGVPLPVLMRLAAEPGIDLVSLQRGDRVADLVASGNRLFVEEMGTQCRDLGQLASIIAGLDLIVTADTVEAHLAGALGKPVWVLLPLGNDWRWVDERDDSVWYPTMRVFRQSPDGSWTRAITRVSEAMAAMAAGKRSRAH